MQYTTTGKVTRVDGDTERTIIHSVTGLTKVIDAVKTLVMWNREYSRGKLVKSGLEFYALEDTGAVWLFGEYTEEFAKGKFDGSPNTFMHGIAGSHAGIAMQDQPRTGTPQYVQAHSPATEFLDCGDVVKEHERVCVPTGCYEDVLVIDEYNPLDPAEGHQRKFYAAGTGLVKVTAVGGMDQETLDLVKVERLSDAQLADVNKQALNLDQHGYRVSGDVYANTPRAEVATESSGGS